MGVRFVKEGDFSETTKMFKRMQKQRPKFDEIGRKGVEALRKATPRATGLTAESWEYTIYSEENGYKIVWYNTNMVGKEDDRRSVAMLIQYGHAFSNGTLVKGIDYINPAMKPIFEELADEAWKMIVQKRKRKPRKASPATNPAMSSD